MGSKNYAKCTFCPSCGVQNIERDRYRYENEPDRKFRGRPEFLCLACGFGFLLAPSKRAESANIIFKSQRKLREPNDL